MSGSAIAMMLLAMVVIWGGLIVAILSLRHSTVPEPTPEDLPRDL